VIVVTVEHPKLIAVRFAPVSGDLSEAADITVGTDGISTSFRRS